MRRLSWLLALASFAGCGGGNDRPACNNTCTSAGATQCSGSQVQTCTADANGCFAWSTAANCGSGQTCQNNACVSVCSTSSVQAACAQAATHVNSCCSLSATADSLCQGAVKQGRDPATDCGSFSGMSCSDLHAGLLAQGICCCPGGQACDPNASNACVPKCSTSADCASVSGRPACAPTIGTVNGSEAVAGPYICVANDGAPGHGCVGAQTCAGGATNVCAADSHGNDFCTTPCTGDAACANSGTACCNVRRTLDASSACGLCGSP